MELQTQKKGDILVVNLDDRIDSAVSKDFEALVMGFVDGGEKKIVMDFSNLGYISSAGLRVLLMAAKRLKASSGKFYLCSMKPNVREVFDVSGFSGILSIVASQDEAMKSIQE